MFQHQIQDEVLIVPDNGEMGLKDLEAMVKEVNATQVAPADKLTDSVYHYDSKVMRSYQYYAAIGIADRITKRNWKEDTPDTQRGGHV